jgi:two-component system response regulator AtoC
MPASAACLDSPSAIPVAPSAGSAGRGPRRIVVVDDDRRLASTTAQWLCGQGWHATAAGSADEALQAIGRGPLDACLLDGILPAGGSLRVAAVLRSTWPEAALLVACPTASPAAAPAELLAVADASLTMPCRDDDLLASLAAAANAARTRAAAPGVAILGEDPSIRAVLDLANRVAATPATVLITGESGTGKSLLARQIHAASRRSGRFVEVACGSLAESLLESELFGHVAGAFTGAVADRDGMFLRADRGTIFLDEIATASPALQVKLLRVLQDFEFEPLGGGDTRRVDARVILATNEHLDQLVANGRFRADLYWRINVVALEMPPLRSRRDDIPLLAQHFLARAGRMVPRSVEGFAPAAENLLLQHAWPGNVRELQHAVERAVLLGRGPLIEPADLPASLQSPPSAAATSLKQALVDPERQLILDALERHGWRRDAAAKALGINRTSLYKKARRLGMDLTALPAG